MGEVIITPSWMKNNLIYTLIILLGTSILPSDENKTAGVMIAGLFLIIAFVNLAKCNDRGVSTKIIYTIGRYGVASLLFVVTGLQLYLYYTEPKAIHLSIYSLVVDGALIAYLVAFKPSNTTFGKKILKIIGYTLVFVAINGLQKVRIETLSYLYPYLYDEINWWMFGLICGILIVGVVCIRIGSKTTEKDTPDDICIDESTTQSYTSSKGLMKNKTENKVNVSCYKHKKYRSKRIILNIILSMILIIYMCSSLSFMDEGDGLTACGVIFYIPCCCIIVTYYLWLIWSKGKATGAKMLLLPLLQRVNLFRTYKDDLKDKIELAKTVLPFLLAVFICPMLTSILYYNVCYNEHSQQEWLIIILLLPPVILVISLAKSLVQNWVGQNNYSEVEE